MLMGYVCSSSDLPIILITKQDVNPMAWIITPVEASNLYKHGGQVASPQMFLAKSRKA
jgi:putative N-acetylmannosamine-6-phosphate epimerase